MRDGRGPGAVGAGAPGVRDATDPEEKAGRHVTTPGGSVLLDVRARTIVKVLVLVLGFEIVVSLMESIRTVLVWTGTALFLAIALNPAVSYVERFVRRTVAVVLVFFAFATGLVAVLAMLVGPFVTQIDNIVADAPRAAERLSETPLIHRLDQRYDVVEKARDHASQLPTIVFGAAGSVVGGITATITIL